MALTSKQKMFADGILAGLTQADAYRQAYSAERMKDATIHREASILMAHPKVAERVQQGVAKLEQAVMIATQSDRERVLQKLRNLLEATEGGPAVTAQLRAAELLGKTCGLYKDVQEVRNDTRSPDEIRSDLMNRLEAYLEDTSDTKH
jgi:hypothetical protein